VIVSPTTRQSDPDQACADAVDLARAAAEEDAGRGLVGAHVGMDVESDRVVTHLFACLRPGYAGWRWAVTVTRAARSKVATVSESVLLPGPDALLAPAWVPWTERVRPGDLKAGDLMPARSDDERLVPAVVIAGEAGLLDWEDSDAWRLGEQMGQGSADERPEPTYAAPEAVAAGGPAAEETGEPQGGAALADQPEAGQPDEDQPEPDEPRADQSIADQSQPDQGDSGAAARGRSRAGARGRSRRRSGQSRARGKPVGMLRPARVLSAAGRDEAAARWYEGDHGPRSALATTAPATCLTCGFMVRLSGPLGRVFGVCANEYAPDDGTVVSVDHGCGAHSEGVSRVGYTVEDMASPTIDELGYDMMTAGATLPDSVLETMDHELL